MKKTIGFCEFCDSFSETYKNNFSYEGKRALFDYLSQLEDDIEEEIECDTVAFCCDYTEYDDALEAMEQYDSENDIVKEKDEKAAREWLEDRTTVIDVDGGGVIISNF